MRGWPAEEAKLRAAGGGEGAVVLWLREAARGGSGREKQEVRGLPAEMIVVCCCCMALSQPEPASVWIGPSLNEGVGNAYTRPIGGGRG